MGTLTRRLFQAGSHPNRLRTSLTSCPGGLQPTPHIAAHCCSQFPSTPSTQITDMHRTEDSHVLHPPHAG